MTAENLFPHIIIMLELICALANLHGGGTVEHSSIDQARLGDLDPTPRTTRLGSSTRIHPTHQPCCLPGMGVLTLDGDTARPADAIELDELYDACGLASFDLAPLPPEFLVEPLDAPDLATAIVTGTPAGREPAALGVTYRQYGTGLGEVSVRDLSPSHERWLPGPLPEAVEALIADVLACDRHRPDVLEPLLWELLVNAVGHRSYAPRWLDTPVVVEQFTDAIRITSPGPLPRCVAVKKGVVEGRWSRNPHLMALLQESKRALQQGRGLTAGPLLARTAGLTLAVEDHADRVVVHLRVVPKLRFSPGSEIRQRLPAGERQARVVAYLLQVEQARTAAIAEALAMPPSTTRATLAALAQAGRVSRTEREPRSPKQAWRLSPAERLRATAAAELDRED